jgi:hypothetical protein
VRWLPVVLLLAGCAEIAGQSSALVTARQAEANRITRVCGLATKTIIVRHDGSIRLRPKPNESYQRVDCALAELRKSKVIGNLPQAFVGNERYDENMQ